MTDENKFANEPPNNADSDGQAVSSDTGDQAVSSNTGDQVVSSDTGGQAALSDTDGQVVSSDAGDQADPSDRKEKSVIREVLEVVVFAVILAVIIRVFIVTPFYIPSESMVPTLQINDKILVSRLNYHFTEPQRGEIVVFYYPRDPKVVFVKRCIAVSGEIVEGKDSVLYINGEAVAEDYLPEGLRFGNFGPTKVPAGCYFMLGDNRNNSDDSRSWGFVNKKLLIGKPVLRIWPYNRAGLVR